MSFSADLSSIFLACKPARHVRGHARRIGDFTGGENTLFLHQIFVINGETAVLKHIPSSHFTSNAVSYRLVRNVHFEQISSQLKNGESIANRSAVSGSVLDQFISHV